MYNVNRFTDEKFKPMDDIDSILCTISIFSNQQFTIFLPIQILIF